MRRSQLLRRVRELGGEIEAANAEADALAAAIPRLAANEHAQAIAEIGRRFHANRDRAGDRAKELARRLQPALNPWSSPAWTRHEPPSAADFPAAVRIGVAGGAQPDNLAGIVPPPSSADITVLGDYWGWIGNEQTGAKRPELASLPVPTVPLLAGLHEHRGFTVIQPCTPDQKQVAVDAVVSAVWRLVALATPGTYEIALVDTERLGAHFSPLLGLPEAVRGSDVASSEQQVAALLSRLRDDAHRITVQALSNQFPDLRAYNAAFPATRRPFRILVACGFPTGFTHESAALLATLLSSGPRAGVCGILVADSTAQSPYGVAVPFVDHCRIISQDPHSGVWLTNGAPVTLDAPPPPAVTKHLTAAVEQRLAQAKNAVLTPGSHALPPTQWWTGSSAAKIEATIGLLEDGKPLTIAFDGKEFNYGLVGGQVGYGKSNLLHALILDLTQRYSPAELELYLVDLKNGVEFQHYTSLPHARVVLLEGEPPAGLAVVQRLQEVIEERSALIKDRTIAAGDLAGYRAKTGKPLSRILLIMDEFQVLLGDPTLGPEAGDALADIVKRGREFGIHAILATQFLSANLARWPNIEPQLKYRIALQCPSLETSAAILGERNGLATTLDGPGEVIMTRDAAKQSASRRGKTFAIADDDPPRQTKALATLAARRGIATPAPWIVNGDEPPSWPADAAARLAPNRSGAPPALRLLLGKPQRVAPDLTVDLPRAPGGALRVFGDDEAGAARIFTAAALSAILDPAARVRALRFPSPNLSSPDWRPLCHLFSRGPDRAAGVADDTEAAAHLLRIATETIPERRQARSAGGPPKPPVLLLVPSLRFWDAAVAAIPQDFVDGAVVPPDSIDLADALLTVAQDGPPVGVHLVLWTRDDAEASAVFGYRTQSLTDACGHRAVLHCDPNASYDQLRSQAAGALQAGSAIYRDAAWPAARLEYIRPYAFADTDVDAVASLAPTAHGGRP